MMGLFKFTSAVISGLRKFLNQSVMFLHSGTDTQYWATQTSFFALYFFFNQCRVGTVTQISRLASVAWCGDRIQTTSIFESMPIGFWRRISLVILFGHVGLQFMLPWNMACNMENVVAEITKQSQRSLLNSFEKTLSVITEVPSQCWNLDFKHLIG